LRTYCFFFFWLRYYCHFFLLRSILFLLLWLLFLDSCAIWERERIHTRADRSFFSYIFWRVSSFKIRLCCDATLSNWLPRVCPVLCCTEFAAGIGIVNILQFRSYSSNLPTTFHVEVCRITTKCFNSTMRACIQIIKSWKWFTVIKLKPFSPPIHP